MAHINARLYGISSAKCNTFAVFKMLPTSRWTVVRKLMLVHLTHMGVVLVQEPVRQSHAVVLPRSVAGVLL